MTSEVNNIINPTRIPNFFYKRKDLIHSGLSLISLIALSAFAVAEKKKEFAIAVGIGAAWQLTLTILKVDRFEKSPKKIHERVHQHKPSQSKPTFGSLVMGCVDGYSRWFIGASPLPIEKIFGGTALAFEHLHFHNLKNNPYIKPLQQTVTFGNFMGVCMGIRLMLAIESLFAGKEKVAVFRPGSGYTAAHLTAAEESEGEEEVAVEEEEDEQEECDECHSGEHEHAASASASAATPEGSSISRGEG